MNPGCWDTDVSATSCALGSAQLAGTGFEGRRGLPHRRRHVLADDGRQRDPRRDRGDPHRASGTWATRRSTRSRSSTASSGCPRRRCPARVAERVAPGFHPGPRPGAVRPWTRTRQCLDRGCIDRDAVDATGSDWGPGSSWPPRAARWFEPKGFFPEPNEKRATRRPPVLFHESAALFQQTGASQSSSAVMPPSFHVQMIFWYVKAISSYSAYFMSSGFLLLGIRKLIDAMFALVSFTV